MALTRYSRIVVQRAPTFPAGLWLVAIVLIPLALAAVIFGAVIVLLMHLLIWALAKFSGPDAPEAVTPDEHTH